MRNYRAVRKLLQLAQVDEGLVCDSVNVLGIGKVVGAYNSADEDLFCIEFLGHSKWQLTHGQIPLMRVEHGIPKLPMEKSQVHKFDDTFLRLFPNTTLLQRQTMSRVATAATRLSHGTVVIIRDNAEQEASRLGKQATMLDPQPLSAVLLETASRIDGAILISPNGLCHAIGVILDGKANDKGSAERGARFNSTVRYVYGSDDVACIGLVVSDDGMVDVFSEYHRRISKEEIERKFVAL